jgi:plasmid stabilization system protein ParE
VKASPVVALPAVEEDIADGCAFYAMWRLDGEACFRQLWRDTVAAIGANPEAFPRRYRRFRRALLPHSHYAAFFVIEPECATVVAVLDLRQRPARIRRALRARA